MDDHLFEIMFYCTCGAFVLYTARPRCTWCKRQHRPKEEWEDEMEAIRDCPPDDCYPIFDPNSTSYPRLACNGPIYQAPTTTGS
ncbi:hypothetical protein F5Y11DRAFT_324048 [Daldinia sp. FL1419]|nr:hypothetical protein F5Y11DRAFT_324048 [Daldinia sp. FL1419]